MEHCLAVLQFRGSFGRELHCLKQALYLATDPKVSPFKKTALPPVLLPDFPIPEGHFKQRKEIKLHSCNFLRLLAWEERSFLNVLVIF